MSSNNTVVTILPTADAENYRLLFAEYGYSTGLSVQLSADGNEPATHLGSHAWYTQAGVDFVNTPSDEKPVPEGWTQEQVIAVDSAAYRSINPEVMVGDPPEPTYPTKSAHFDYAAATQGLERVTEDEPAPVDTFAVNRMGTGGERVTRDMVTSIEAIVNNPTPGVDLYVVTLTDGRQFPMFRPTFEKAHAWWKQEVKAAKKKTRKKKKAE